MRNHPIRRNHIVIGTYMRAVRNELTRELEMHEFLLKIDASALVTSLGTKAVVSKARESKSVHGAIIVTDMRKVT